MSKTLTIIPAKLGSTRLPQKNIRQLAGKPLILYTIEAALASGVCGEVMVSTESQKVAEIATEAGASVPFMRPEYLGKDPSGVVDVCLNVLSTYKKQGKIFEKLTILLPTSPFRGIDDIRTANELFEDSHAKFLMSVSEYEHSPYGALRAEPDHKNRMIPCFPEYIGRKRHEVPQSYRANGAICIVNATAFKKAGTYYGAPLYVYEMPWYRSIDIDTEIDFNFAEFIIEKRINDDTSQNRTPGR